MPNPFRRTYFNWSSGKDSALALYRLQQEGIYDIRTLVTTVNKSLERVSMHGLREALLDLQARSLGFPLYKIYLPDTATMSVYDEVMDKAVRELKAEGHDYAAFGDIFLEDLRQYREEKLSGIGVQAVFPLWKNNSRELMEEFISSGFKAITVCVNARILGEAFCGREVDRDFLDALPAHVDPCGENGEFHTFVYDGPLFRTPVRFDIGENVRRTYGDAQDGSSAWDNAFWYCDLKPL